MADVRNRVRTEHTATPGPDVLAPYREPPGPRQPFTQVPDWVMLCERVTPTAFRLWSILRSMQFEKGPGIPPLTLDGVCWLLPGVNGRPTSKGRAREALDCLLAEGILEDVSADGVPKSAPRLYLTHDTPRKPVEWPSARSKLKKYLASWRVIPQESRFLKR